MVNRRFVEQFLDGRNPVGRTFRMTDYTQAFEISGVVADVREDALNTVPVPYVYICLGPGSWPDPEYVVRTAGVPAPVMREIREAVHGLDPSRAVFGLDTLANVVEATLDEHRFDAQMITLFAAAALLLASVGVYSLVSLIVISQTREIGLRMALGAAPSRIARHVTLGTVRLILTGVGAGAIANLLGWRVLHSILFEIEPFNFATLALSVIVIALVTGVAVLMPAHRAAMVDPIQAIRIE